MWSWHEEKGGLQLKTIRHTEENKLDLYTDVMRYIASQHRHHLHSKFLLP